MVLMCAGVRVARAFEFGIIVDMFFIDLRASDMEVFSRRNVAGLRRIFGHRGCGVMVCLLVILAFDGGVLGQRARTIVPLKVEPSKTVDRVANDKLLDADLRVKKQLFHGLFDKLEESSRNTAEFALATWDLHSELLSEKGEGKLVRAKAAYRRGDLHLVEGLLKGVEGAEADLLRARAHIAVGRFDVAVKLLTPMRVKSVKGEYKKAAEIVAGALAVTELAKLEGRAASEYHHTMKELLRAQQRVDRLYWPAILEQARLLLSKDNPEKAVGTLQEVLPLNPNSSEVYYELGGVALMGFNFTDAGRAILKLRRINPQHVLADVLEIKMYLTQRDPVTAQQVLLEALQRYPNHRELLALSPAVAALSHDEETAKAALKQYDSISGKNPRAYYLTGLYLSRSRQYKESEVMLKEAIRRQPNWPTPQVELGMMLSQYGKEDEALAVLTKVLDIDPFNRRAINTLKLHKELAKYKRIETEHFIILFRDEIDRALAADMPEELEAIHELVVKAFEFEPREKTLIEILPDKRWFAIRIIGVPDIWTVGACTGRVIGITPPRTGKYQSGYYDWYRVLRHEYVHTVTLAQTGNRVPHWFTEAAAVSLEPAPRDYDTCRLLAGALKNGTLFTLDTVNWGFVRPKKPTDRSQAYAQSHWMFEYIEERWGRKMIIKMLGLSRDGVPQNLIVSKATGLSNDQFMKDFKVWAQKQVESWGMAPKPDPVHLLSELKLAEDKDKALAELLKKHPKHPTLLKKAAEAALSEDDATKSYEAVKAYSKSKPVDPWGHRKMAELALEMKKLELAGKHLSYMDKFDQKGGQHSMTLTDIYRRLGDMDKAQYFAQRALHRQPYQPKLRETAAIVALQNGDEKAALRHLKALTLVEPGESVNFVRYAALLYRMDRKKEAHEAALAAKKLDGEAPVERFMIKK